MISTEDTCLHTARGITFSFRLLRYLGLVDKYELLSIAGEPKQPAEHWLLDSILPGSWGQASGKAWGFAAGPSAAGGVYWPQLRWHPRNRKLKRHLYLQLSMSSRRKRSFPQNAAYIRQTKLSITVQLQQPSWSLKFQKAQVVLVPTLVLQL